LHRPGAGAACRVRRTGGARGAALMAGRGASRSAGRSEGRVEATIAQLVERYGLPQSAAAGLLALTGLIATDDHAPTTVRDPARIIADHLADSLAGLEL